jgi:hypothetical protein
MWRKFEGTQRLQLSLSSIQERLLWLVVVASLLPAHSLASVIQLPDEAAVEARVAAITSSDPKIFQQILWVKSLAQALKLSQIEHRPVFLFTHDGNMNTGRC